MKMNNTFTLVTGASSGIGLELARIFAANKHNLVLVARNKEKLETLAKELAMEFQVQTEIIVADLNTFEGCEEVYKTTKKHHLHIDCLVNNAGFGLVGKFDELDLNKQQEMIDLNIKAPVTLTHLFLVDFKSKNYGRILNVASIAAFFPGPFMNVYYATKAFLLSFSSALSKELENTDISVTCLCPGAVKTNFQKVSGIDNLKYLSQIPTVSPREVANQAYKALMNKKKVIIPGLPNKISALISRLMPRSVALNIIKRIQTSK